MDLASAKSLKAAACALTACLIWVMAAAGQAPVATSHTAELSGPRVDVLDDGRVAVSVDAAGDLAGTMTLMLTPNGDGTYGGEWAITVGHVDNTDPETGVEPETAEAAHQHADGEPAETAPHRDFVRIIRRGALNGTIANATISFGPDGLADLVANLAITQGASEFSGATGTGVATLSSLTLIF